MEDELELDQSLQVLRIEKNKNQTIFVYYKPYPKRPNSKFDSERSLLVFYFDNETVNERFLKEYFSLAGDVESFSFGKYLNKKGSKNKRKVVNFAIISFANEEAVQTVMDRSEFQLKVNNFVERKRGGLNLEYDPTNLDPTPAAEVDEEGFVKVTGNSNNMLM